MEKAESDLDSTEKVTLKREEFTNRIDLIRATLALESWLVMNCPTIGQQHNKDAWGFPDLPFFTIRKPETRNQWNAYKMGTILLYKREDHHLATSLFVPTKPIAIIPPKSLALSANVVPFSAFRRLQEIMFQQ